MNPIIEVKTALQCAHLFFVRNAQTITPHTKAKIHVITFITTYMLLNRPTQGKTILPKGAPTSYTTHNDPYALASITADAIAKKAIKTISIVN